MKLYKNLNLLTFCVMGLIPLISSPVVMASEDLSEIKSEINALKQDYEQRIHDLEKRLLIAEQELAKSADENQTKPLVRSNASSYASASNKYNPAIGIILDGEMVHKDPNRFA